MIADPYRRAAAAELDPAPAPSTDEDDRDPFAPVALPARKRGFIADHYEIDARPRVVGIVFGMLLASSLIWVVLRSQ